MAAVPGHRWSELERLLDPAEQARARRFRLDRDRRAYIAAHALLRALLSWAVPSVRPEGWRFVAGDYGKPRVARPLPSCQVNLSHTPGLVAVALSRGYELGVDVEWLQRRPLGLDVARRFFAPAEYALLTAQPPARREETLLALWTLKEAYIKAVGRGLSMPLNAFAFELEPLAVEFSPELDDNPAQWLFRRYRPTPAHVMALAVRHPSPEDLAVRVTEADVDFVLS